VLHPAPAFCRSLHFNYSPSVASVCEQFTHASELKKEKKRKGSCFWPSLCSWAQQKKMNKKSGPGQDFRPIQHKLCLLPNTPLYPRAEPKHKIKGGQNTVVCVVSYKNTKNKLKGGWKKNLLAGPGPCQPSPVSAPAYTFTM
jgi:hypothetical protein